jgi:galactokinase
MALEDLIKKAQSTFHHQFGDIGKHVTLVAAPSRITLLGGEYTEAVDGYSLVAAGSHSVVVAAQRRNDRQAVIHSLAYDEKIKINLSTLKFDRADGWANFPKGVLYFYERTGRKFEGIQMVIVSDIPEDAGLGISAAIDTATAVACNILGTQPLDDATLVKLCQRVESQFVGGDRGDYFTPFAAKLGKKDRLVVFDARSFKPDYLPFDSKNYKLVVVDSGVKKKERDEEYKKRLELFKQLLVEIRKYVPKVISIRDVDGDAYEDARKKMDIILRKRLDHVVYENQRVRRAKEILARGDYEAFGQLLNHSHESLADKLKVTCSEVDILWNITQAMPGCLGARMAGIGWGGHLVCLVRAGEVQAFCDQVRAEYKKKVNINAKVYVYEPEEGAREVAPVVSTQVG